MLVTTIYIQQYLQMTAVAIVSPIGKGPRANNTILNYGWLSVLNYFSLLYGTIIKIQLVPFIKSNFSTFVSVYRESYNTQH